MFAGSVPQTALRSTILTKSTSSNAVCFPKATGHNIEFSAIPELYRHDAQVDLFFLLNDVVQYVQPVYDPWFKATVATVYEEQGYVGGVQNVTLYSTSTPVSVLGCATQWQWCNPHNGLCTEMSDLYTAYNQTRGLHFITEQFEVMNRMYRNFGDNIITNVADYIGNNALLASQYALGGAGTGLPSDQWIRELGK